MVSPENRHISNNIWTKQVIYRNKCICTYELIKKLEDENLESMWKGLERENERKTCCSYIISTIKKETELLYDLSTALLSIHLENYHRYSYILMFIVVTFITARKWNQPRCSSTDKCIMKLWTYEIGIYAMDILHILNNNELLKFLNFYSSVEKIAEKWVKLGEGYK